MLTGRPEEEMPSSVGDLLQELSQMHERARQVMHGVAQALWPSSLLPNGMGSLRTCFKEPGGAFVCGRYRPAGKEQEKPGQW